MDYLIEAKKFIQRAQQADNPEVTKTDLEMAGGCFREKLGSTRQPRASQVKVLEALLQTQSALVGRSGTLIYLAP